MANRIKIGDMEFPSCAAAARHFGMTKRAMQFRLDRGTLEGLLARKPLKDAVTIRGVTYASQAEAAAALGVVPSAIAKAKARGNLDGVGDGKSDRKRKG